MTDDRVVATYDAVAAAYADQLIDELDGKPFDRWLLERLAHEAGDASIADVGCGPGQVGAFVAQAGTGEVTGFDLSPGMVAEARHRFPELRFEVADLHALPAPARQEGWALLVAWYSLVHLTGAELPAALQALVRALRPGGTLAFAVHLGGHVGGETRHRDQWFDRAVDIDFTFHDADQVIAAAYAAGLTEIEWYRRSPHLGRESETERLYVVGRRRTSE